MCVSICFNMCFFFAGHVSYWLVGGTKCYPLRKGLSLIQHRKNYESKQPPRPTTKTNHWGCTLSITSITWVVPPPRMPVTTRIITFLVGDPYKPSFATVTGRGDNPKYNSQNREIEISVRVSLSVLFHDAWGWSCCLRIIDPPLGFTYILIGSYRDRIGMEACVNNPWKAIPGIIQNHQLRTWNHQHLPNQLVLLTFFSITKNPAFESWLIVWMISSINITCKTSKSLVAELFFASWFIFKHENILYIYIYSIYIH